jgi:type I restriction enzyme S subunit
MGEWKPAKLGDLIKIKGGFGYKGEFIGSGDSFLLGMGCVSFSEKFLTSGARPYSGSCPAQYFVEPGQLVLATRQQSDNLPILGLPAIIPESFENKKVIVGANLYRVENTSSVPNTFLYWLMKTPEYYNHILSCAKGSTVRMITKDAVELYEFLLPPLPEQQAIAEVLSSLDDKIDLLHRNNKTLEQMAETLFRQWLNNNICADETTLGEYCKAQGGYAFKGGDFKETGTVGVIKIRNISFESVDVNNTQYVDQDVVKSIDKKFLVKPGAFLIAMTGAEIGKIGVVGNSNKQLWLNQRVAMLVDKYKYGALMGYMLFKSEAGQDYILNTASGSAQENISSAQLESLIVPKLTPDRLLAMGKIINPLIEKKQFNLGLIQKLEETRDTLLPKLMSGQVRVKLY